MPSRAGRTSNNIMTTAVGIRRRHRTGIEPRSTTSPVSFVALLSLLLTVIALQDSVTAVESHNPRTQKQIHQQRHGSRRHLTKEQRRQEFEKYSRILNSNGDNIMNQPQPRVFGGWDTIEGRFDYAQVSLDTVADGHQCGGSLIAVDVILTAAHCAGTYNRIVVGKHNLYDPEDEGEIFEPLMEIIHPDYDDVTTRFDIMLIILDGWSTLASPVRVNDDSSLPLNGQSLTVVGFGYTSDWELPDILQQTEVIYTRNADCILLQDSDGYTLENDLYPDMLCAGDVGRDSCYGDSGSPLILKGDSAEQDVQMGLVSWGYVCAGDLPGIYSRVGHWQSYEFIRSTVCEHSISPPTTYMDCGDLVPRTSDPVVTTAPTPKPTFIPTDSVTPPSLAPTTAALKEFLQGTSSASTQTSKEEKEEVSQVYDDAYFLREKTPAQPMSMASKWEAALLPRLKLALW
ncbi:peptidase S1 and S6 chymotrypsin/Hap family protein [Nitzschia inconspicua]|uniref:Peptidase S1 and S6 chymotrypsin/Hap family protein n=1 Tax=Nitzschia inconspicua TaxID=303405 RepID=A0A9K3LCK3_9STRA|nr:peptidase S1 and S6 chymotrypsin/Hap family protein [Nitzschia inconspicua]